MKVQLAITATVGSLPLLQSLNFGSAEFAVKLLNKS